MKHRIIATCLFMCFLLAPLNGFAAQFNFTPTLTASEEYNDNIFLSSDNEEDDYLTSARLGLNAELLGHTSGLQLNYRPKYTWYAHNSEFDYWQHNAYASLWHDFSPRTHLALRNAYVKTADPQQNSANIENSGDALQAPLLERDQNRRGLKRYYRNATTLRLDHQFGAEDTVFSELRYSLLENNEKKDDDNRIWDANLGATYWFTNFWGMQTTGGYSHRDYEDGIDRQQYNGRLRLNRRVTRHFDLYAQYAHTRLDYDQDRDDYTIYEPTAGFNYQLDQNTRIQIGGGWYFQSYDNGGTDDGAILNSVSEKIWPFHRGLIGLTLVSGLDIDDRGINDLGLRRYAGLNGRANYNFTPRFGGNVNAGYRVDDYPDRNPDRTDFTYTAGAGLEYQLLRWMFFNLDYNYRNRDADNNNDDYTENRIAFSITLRPDQPYRAQW